MCFNLLYPLIRSEEKKAFLLTTILKVTANKVKGCRFEKSSWLKDRTSFDFYMKLDNGSHIYFELKLKETEFGRGGKSPGQLRKKHSHYLPRLQGNVPDKYLQFDNFIKHYQILRNIAHLDSDGDKYYIIFPRENVSLKNKISDIQDISSKGYNGQVNILFLEEIVKRILEQKRFDDPVFRTHYLMFKEKYIIQDVP
jgi:hypothetical protein